MRFVHLTDLHLTEPPATRSLRGRSHWGKRYLGLASWRRTRRWQLRAEWYAELVDAVRAAAPDQVVITGDLAQIGTTEEIRAARSRLEALGAPERVVLVPGNHDVYAHDSWPSVASEWAEYLHLDEHGSYPCVRVFGDVVVVGLNSALPTMPLSAAGALGRAQLARLDQVLGAHPQALKIVLLHHPPLPGMTRYRKRLRDGKALARLLEAHRVGLVLHGHQHRNRVREQGALRIFCTAPASSEVASFRVIDVAARDASMHVTATLMQRGQGVFEAVESVDWSISASG